MIDDVSDIKTLYDNDPEKEHNRLESHQLEHDITWRYFDKYLPVSGAILEIGAATGKYTLELVKRGYAVTAVDLSESLLEICQRRIAETGLEGQVKYILADARDLSALNGEVFDAVLLMGPLYHLVFEKDRLLALQEVYQRLKPGGVLFSSFINRFGIFGDLLKNIPEWIEDQTVVRSLIKQGRRPDDYPRGGFRGYFATVSEIAPLHEKAGFTTLVVAAAEPAISADDESYNTLEGKRREAWLDLLFEISTNETIIGASRHLLYIGRK